MTRNLGVTVCLYGTDKVGFSYLFTVEGEAGKPRGPHMNDAARELALAEGARRLEYGTMTEAVWAMLDEAREIAGVASGSTLMVFLPGGQRYGRTTVGGFRNMGGLQLANA